MLGAIFDWFKSFFREVAGTAIGVAAEEMSEAAITVVGALEEEGVSGKEKYDRAKSALKDRYPSAESAAINLAIETALAIIRDRK